MNRIREKEEYNTILDIVMGYKKSQVLFTALRLNVFLLIGNGVNSAEEISNMTDANESNLEKLLNALVAMKLLVKKGKRFFNTPISEKRLLKENNDYYGFMLREGRLWDDYSNLYDVVCTGNRQDKKYLYKQSREHIEEFITAMDGQVQYEIGAVLEWLPLRFTHSFLKVGAATMRYAFDIASHYTNMNVSIIDFSNVIEAAQNVSNKLNFDMNSVDFIKCNLLEEDIPGKFDVVYVDSFFDGHSIQESIEIMRKIYKCIANSGKLIFHNNLLDDARTSPLNSVFNSVDLMLSTQSGEVYSYPDVWVILKESGFDKISDHKTELGSIVVEATKSKLG